MVVDIGQIWLPPDNDPYREKGNKAAEHVYKNPASKAIADNFFGNEFIIQCHNIINTHKVLTPIEEEHIHVSYETANILFQAYDDEGAAECVGWLLTRYSTDELVRTLHISRICHMLMWQGQYFLDKSQKDKSYLDKVHSVIEYVDQHINEIGLNKDFAYRFACTKLTYKYLNGQYQEILDELSHDEYENIWELPDIDMLIFAVETKLTVMTELKQYDAALALIAESFSHIGNYILDHPENKKWFLDLEKEILRARWFDMFQQRNYIEAEKSLGVLLQKDPTRSDVEECLSLMLLSVSSRNLDANPPLDNLLFEWKLLLDLRKYEEAQTVFDEIANMDFGPEDPDGYEIQKKAIVYLTNIPNITVKPI